MTTAQRREEILALLNQADAPIAAKDLAARFGVSRQVIVQDLAVIRASRPNIISTNRGYILQQQETGCLREFKVRHTPEQAGQELNLIVDHGGRVSLEEEECGACFLIELPLLDPASLPVQRCGAVGEGRLVSEVPAWVGESGPSRAILGVPDSFSDVPQVKIAFASR